MSRGFDVKLVSMKKKKALKLFDKCVLLGVQSTEWFLNSHLKMNNFVSALIHKPKYFESGLLTSHYLNLDPKVLEAISYSTSRIGNNPYPTWKIVNYLFFATNSQKIEGAYFELGVGQGFMTCAALRMQNNKIESPRRYYLFDKFDNFTVDDLSGSINSEARNDAYATSLEQVKNNLRDFKDNCTFVPGLLPLSLKQIEIPKIAFLHIDLNAAQPEVESLEILWDHVVPGGMVILDDYSQAGRRAQFNAMNILSRKIGFQILSLPTGQGLILK